MPCDVYLYNRLLAPLQNTAILIHPASYPMGGNLTRHINNAQIPGSLKWGAHLPFPPQQIVYTVTAHDPIGTYAPVHVTNLNGTQTGTLEIVMFPKPPSGSQRGAPPLTAHNIATYINSQTWSMEEKTGTRHLVLAVWEVRGTTNPVLSDFLIQWENWLGGLGIDPTLI
jgi:hypothetical protein